MNEYDALRSEIRDNMQAIVQYESILYTAVAAILAFALGSTNYLLSLIPYVAIIPCYFIVMSRKSAVCRIGTYIYVFYEAEEPHWERRVYQHDLLFSSARKKSWLKNPFLYPWKTHFQYYILSLTCSLTACYEITCSDYSFKWKLGR